MTAKLKKVITMQNGPPEGAGPLPEGEKWRILLDEEKAKARERLKGAVISTIVITAFAVFMILHLLHKREAREHIKQRHPEMLDKYDQQEYEASAESRDRRG